MSSSANVGSIDSIRRFRAALMEFQERLGGAMSSVRMESDRLVNWIEQDRPQYWREQTRLAHHAVAAARTALEAAKMRKVAGRTPACVDEQVALKKAMQRLQYCEQKNVIVRQAGNKVRHEHDEFRGRTSPVTRTLESDIPKVIGMLGVMIDALEKYSNRDLDQEAQQASIASPLMEWLKQVQETGDPSLPIDGQPVPAQAETPDSPLN